MAIADGGELIVLAPGVKTFGEDPQIDALIRKYGYGGTPRVMQFVRETDDLPKNLSAAAHLIHGSSEGRFRITYCPGHLSREEIESVGYGYADLNAMLERYRAAVAARRLGHDARRRTDLLHRQPGPGAVGAPGAIAIAGLRLFARFLQLVPIHLLLPGFHRLAEVRPHRAAGEGAAAERRRSRRRPRTALPACRVPAGRSITFHCDVPRTGSKT